MRHIILLLSVMILFFGCAKTGFYEHDDISIIQSCETMDCETDIMREAKELEYYLSNCPDPRITGKQQAILTSVIRQCQQVDVKNVPCQPFMESDKAITEDLMERCRNP